MRPTSKTKAEGAIPRAGGGRHSDTEEEFGAARGRVADEVASLHRSEFDEVTRLAHLLTGSGAVAEELAREVFARMQQHERDPVNRSRYLRVSVVKLSRARHRSGERERLARSLGDPHSDGMWRALASLGFRQRSALVLRYYEDLPVEEIAAILRCRPRTAESLLRRGLLRLQRAVPASTSRNRSPR